MTFNLSTKYVPNTLHNQIVLYSLLVMLLDQDLQDEDRSRREDHVVEVRQALGCKSAESPYLAC
jgi:hypothetical protein